jgi:hypothetical protein
MRLVGMQVDMIVDKTASLSLYPTPEIQSKSMSITCHQTEPLYILSNIRN